MRNLKGEASLPSVVVVIRKEKPTPQQAAQWRQLWAKLLEVPKESDAPECDGPGRGAEGNDEGGTPYGIP